MSSRIGAVATAVTVVLVTVFLVVLADDNPDPGRSCVPDSKSAASVAQGVPAGRLSRPMRSADAALTSGFQTPDRPGHQGVDLAGAVGAPIFAMADGVVTAAGPASGFGDWIVIDHNLDGQPYSTVYGHMFETGIHVAVGQQIKAGDYIADEGYNGEVDPPGPQGAHLHFEVWQGQRLAGGTPIDPAPWIDRAAEPGTSSPESAAATGASAVPGPASAHAEVLPVASADPELAPLPGSVGSEEHLQIDAIRVARAVAHRFPEVTTIGGWRPSDPISQDHPSGVAVDVMIPDYSSAAGRQLGDSIRDYLWANREQLNLVYLIWRQQYIPVDGQPEPMEDRGDTTANHFDHVHITTEGHGHPAPGQTYGGAPQSGPEAPSAPSRDCTTEAPGRGEDLHSDMVTTAPPEFRKWLVLSARQCRELSPTLLDAQLQQEEAGYRPGQTSPMGARGYAQFMPATWDEFGYSVDDNGQRVGPAGAGDPNNIGDAVMAQGAYNCWLADKLRPQIAAGEVVGDPIDLMLAAYNAGPDEVTKYRGIPPFSETQLYVSEIKARVQKMEAQTNR
ncbi:M23 family metallopeptidase [Nocardia sp. XZ_19_369]|uniref:M23 family metallopeptidase n=1 Tax=Nocardia sp. XZ_19_369 TaxID=2769487 RepID=UPI0027D1E9CB|nr:M23 family metallopeptidase [Nocardia sp. XZ_19_369]